jgi:2',3'-cyclic-nucleotide 2'-phosphodiesterase (5'-nucleotidase family)
MLANVLDPALGEGVPIGNAKKTHMITASNGLKIGLMGLGEREWLDTINLLPPNIIYRSASEVARELVPQLRAEGADIIIAITHMREPNDNKLATNLGGENIDIILGGHDHFYAHSLINGTHVLRSGSDFKQLSYLEVRRAAPGSGRKWDVDIWRRDIVRAIPEDAETVALVHKLTAKLKKNLEKAVGWTAAPLDARFTTVRTRESNLGNFVCDIMRHHYNADCALMAAGTIRGDQVYAPGPVRVKDVTDCFPFEDPVVVMKVSGKGIWDALENGVSLYPALEGIVIPPRYGALYVPELTRPSQAGSPKCPTSSSSSTLPARLAPASCRPRSAAPRWTTTASTFSPRAGTWAAARMATAAC